MKANQMSKVFVSKNAVWKRS